MRDVETHQPLVGHQDRDRRVALFRPERLREKDRRRRQAKLQRDPLRRPGLARRYIQQQIRTAAQRYVNQPRVFGQRSQDSQIGQVRISHAVAVLDYFASQKLSVLARRNRAAGHGVRQRRECTRQVPVEQRNIARPNVHS